LAVKVSDKFGEHGVTALIIIKLNGIEAEIDSFLMSCRIIGRNIEYALMDNLIKILGEKGIERLKSSYIVSSRNSQVANLYEKFGFEVRDKAEKSTSYVINVNDYVESGIDYIKIV